MQPKFASDLPSKLLEVGQLGLEFGGGFRVWGVWELGFRGAGRVGPDFCACLGMMAVREFGVYGMGFRVSINLRDRFFCSRNG